MAEMTDAEFREALESYRAEYESQEYQGVLSRYSEVMRRVGEAISAGTSAQSEEAMREGSEAGEALREADEVLGIPTKRGIVQDAEVKAWRAWREIDSGVQRADPLISRESLALSLSVLGAFSCQA